MKITSNLSNKKQLALNIVSTFAILGINACINLFLSPYIVKTVGVEAQGFVQLANNFTSYISILLIAVNSMSGRFIAIEYHKGNLQKAQGFYTTIFVANIFLVLLLIVPMLLCVIYLERIINIPAELVFDVKILFSLAFVNLLVSNALSLWGNVFFIADRIYLQSIITIVSNSLYAVILLIMFLIFYPKVWYPALISLALLPLTILWNFYCKNKLLPELKVEKKHFERKLMMDVLSSGIWRSIQSTGEMLLTGLDLLICNLMIDPQSMGVLALAKTVPNVVLQLNWRISSTFSPKLTMHVARNEQESIKIEMRRACKINAIIGTIPIAGLIVFGMEFFTLWLPSQNPKQLHILSVLTCFSMAIASGIQPIGNVFLAVNKVRPQAISVVVAGIFSIIATFLCLRFTSLGVYAVAGISSVFTILRNLLYTAPAAAKFLGFKWNTFYYGFKYSIIGSVAVFAVGQLVKLVIQPHSIFTLILACGITAVLSLLLNTVIIFDRNETRSLFNSIFSKLLHKNENES